VTPGSGAAAPPEGETAAGSSAAAKRTEPPTASVPRQLSSRREAASRLPTLRCGRRDPLIPADHDGWRDQYDVLMAQLGWAPPWQVERARQLRGAGAR
jgi:hypothetical protein